MASKQQLFQVLLLASSLGWNGVFADRQQYGGQDRGMHYGHGDGSTNGTSSSSAEQTLAAPQLGVSATSLVVPTTSTIWTSSSSSSYSIPIAYSPATGHTAISLDVPTTHTNPPPSTSSTTFTAAPVPVTQHTDLSLDVPDTTTSSSARTRHHTFKSPQLEHSHTGSLIIPGHGDGSSSTSTPDIAYSPGTAHSQTSLQVPPTTTVLAPIVVTAKSETKLIVPTPRPGGNENGGGNGNGNVATVSLPPEQGHGHGHGGGGGPPMREPAHEEGGHEGGQEGHGPGPWEEFVSIVNEGDEGETGSSAPPASQTGWSTYQIHDGASAATIDGTTYAVGPSGGGVYVNGQTTASATDSVAMAVMSALGGGDDEDAGTSSSSSTFATTTTSSEAAATSNEAGGSEASQGAAPQQTDSGAASLVLPGVGLGGVGLVMALL